jgi:Response regulators consisting of a CheY-like receiver domain and a winged-helix DNA-binding domain
VVAPTRLVLIEDDAPLRRVLTRVLADAGYRVHAYGCVMDFDDDLRREPVDLFLLDVQLPGESGLSLCQRLRQHYPRAGLAILSGQISQEEIALGYGSGADVYLTKPLHTDTLLSALVNLARRSAASQPLAATSGLQLDIAHSRLLGPGGQVRLNLAQCQLLQALALAPQHRLSTWQLTEVMGLILEGHPKGPLEQRISRLRAKLAAVGADPNTLQPIYGDGYRLTAPLKIF